jgi:hypothetical protein
MVQACLLWFSLGLFVKTNRIAPALGFPVVAVAWGTPLATVLSEEVEHGRRLVTEINRVRDSLDRVSEDSFSRHDFSSYDRAAQRALRAIVAAVSRLEDEVDDLKAALDYVDSVELDRVDEHMQNVLRINARLDEISTQFAVCMRKLSQVLVR